MLINLDIQKPNGLMAWEAAVQLKKVPAFLTPMKPIVASET